MKKVILLLLIASVGFFSSPAYAGDDWMLEVIIDQANLKIEDYVNSNRSRAENRENSVKNAISNDANANTVTVNGSTGAVNVNIGAIQDPRYYEGNTIFSPIYPALWEDFLEHIRRFFDCFEPSIAGLCWKRIRLWKGGPRIWIPVGIGWKYWWPYTHVFSHKYFGSRYGPPWIYNLLKIGIEFGWYNIVDSFYANVRIQIVETLSAIWTNVAMLAWGEDAFAPAWNSSSNQADLERHDERLRHAAGYFGKGQSKYLEYGLGPTFWQIVYHALKYIYNISSIIEAIICLDDRIAYPIFTDDPIHIMFGRMPELGLILFGNNDLFQNMLLWYLDPLACIGKNQLDKSDGGGETPTDTFLLATRPKSYVEDYHSYCVADQGSTLPYTATTYHYSDIVAAEVNFVKAITFSHSFWATFLDYQNQDYIYFWPWGDRDKMQPTYGPGFSTRCTRPPVHKPPYSGDDPRTYKGSSNWAFTHWVFIKCCRSGQFR